MTAAGNLFENLAAPATSEHSSDLVGTADVRIERIVSHGHASPPGFWFDQDRAEWVVILAGSAGLLFEGEAAPRILRAGDHLTIAAHVRHRVEWTDAAMPTIWLAVHYG